MKLGDYQFSQAEFVLSLRELNEWLVVGAFDATCIHCGACYLICCSPDAPQFPSGVLLVCCSCAKSLHPTDLSSIARNLLQDRFEFANDRSLEDLSVRFSNLLSSRVSVDMGELIPKNEKLTKTESNSKGEVNVPVPEGFRNVAWVRPYEAQAVVEAINSKADVQKWDEHGALSLICHYVAPESPEAMKYHSSCQVVRVRPRGPRVLGWIRREEAEAILEAVSLQESVTFEHSEYGSGGIAEYFDPEGPAALRYRSPTRLLRKQ
jgi:hypothetical protein